MPSQLSLSAMEWVLSFMGWYRPPLDWSWRVRLAARYPHLREIKLWAEEARLQGYDKFDDDIHEEIQKVTDQKNERLRKLIKSSGRPRILGSPSEWNWPVDVESELHCVQVLLTDALEGNVYESGAPEHRVARGPPIMSGEELRDKFHESYNRNEPKIWRAEPSFSGYHFWALVPFACEPPSPAITSLQSPTFSTPLRTNSSLGAQEVDTPASSLPSASVWLGSPPRPARPEPKVNAIDDATITRKTRERYGRSLMRNQDPEIAVIGATQRPGRRTLRLPSAFTQEQNSDVNIGSPATRAKMDARTMAFRQSRQESHAPASSSSSRPLSPSGTSMKSRSNSVASSGMGGRVISHIDRRDSLGQPSHPRVPRPASYMSAPSRNTSRTSVFEEPVSEKPLLPEEDLVRRYSISSSSTDSSSRRQGHSTIKRSQVPQTIKSTPHKENSSSRVLKQLQSHFGSRAPTPAEHSLRRLASEHASSTVSLPNTRSSSTSRPSSVYTPAVSSKATQAPRLARWKGTNASIVMPPSAFKVPPLPPPSEKRTPSARADELPRRGRGMSASAVPPSPDDMGISIQPVPFRKRGNSVNSWIDD